MHSHLYLIIQVFFQYTFSQECPILQGFWCEEHVQPFSIESGLLFMPMIDVTMPKEVCYEIGEKIELQS